MSNSGPDQTRNLVFHLGLDASMEKDLGRRLAEHHLRLQYFERATVLAAAIRRTLPGVLILELTMVPKDTTLTRFLADIMGSPDSAPLLICTLEVEGIAHRLQAVRAGAKALFLAPVVPAELAA